MPNNDWDILQNFSKALVSNGDGTFSLKTSGGGTPGGSSGQVQYNNAGSFGGLSTTTVNADGTVNILPETIAVTGTTKTLAITDANSIQDCSNAAGVTVTIPLNASVPFRLNDSIVFEQNAAGLVTVTAAGGVTLNGVVGGSVTTSAIFSGFYIRQESTDVWYAEGSAQSGVSTLTNSDGTITLSASSGPVVVSLAPSHANTWTGLQTLKISDAGTNTVTNVGVLTHDTSGTPASSFGTGLAFQGQSTTTVDRPMANINAIWDVATDASRTTKLQIQTLNNSQSLATIATFGFPSGALAASNFLNITGTFPTTLSATTPAVSFQITTAGSSSFQNAGLLISLLPGYTGSSLTLCANFSNTTAGVGTSLVGAGANYGSYQAATATTTGVNVGGFHGASNGNTNIASSNIATTTKNSATNVGVFALALNAGTSPIQVGGFFGMQAGAPTFASCALCADNGATTSPVFLARVNGATQVSITSLGSLVVGVAGALSTSATDGFLYIPTCAGTPTGVPTTQTGTVAQVYDTTNNKLYVYNGAWKGVTLS